MRSPCVGICSIDPDSGYCWGCARTVEEIVRWMGFSDAEREAIWAELPTRFGEPPAG